MPVKTIEVIRLADDQRCIINASDFDPALHHSINDAAGLGLPLPESLPDNPPFTPEALMPAGGLVGRDAPLPESEYTSTIRSLSHEELLGHFAEAQKLIANLQAELGLATDEIAARTLVERDLLKQLGTLRETLATKEAAWLQAEQEMEGVARARWQNELRYAMVDRLDELQGAYDKDGHDPISARAKELGIDKPENWGGAIASIVLQEQLIQLPEEEAELEADDG